MFASGWFDAELERIIALISPYVQADTNGFFTYEAFQAAAATLRTFCEKRVQSLNGQLAGHIPTTSEGQRGSSALIDASDVDLSSMGGMDAGGMNSRGDRSGPQRTEGFGRSERLSPPDGASRPDRSFVPAQGLSPAASMPQAQAVPSASVWPSVLASAAILALAVILVRRAKGNMT